MDDVTTKVRGKYLAEILDVSQELQQGARRTLFHIDTSKPRAKVYMVNADEGDQLYSTTETDREALYPFGQEPITEVNAVPRQPEARVIDSEGHRQLVKDILAGEVKAGYCLKPSQVSKYDLHGIVEAARAKSKRAKQLQVAMADLTKHNTTLGKDFWTTDLREGLTDALKEEYDDVVREELKDSCLNTKLEPARIRLTRDRYTAF